MQLSAKTLLNNVVTDHAGNSAQARVNRKTVEYLRSSTEIHLVEIAKFANDRGQRLFVPHITAGDGPVDRSQRQLEVWKRNAFLLLKNAPQLHPALLDYVNWLDRSSDPAVLRNHLDLRRQLASVLTFEAEL